jgi:hypothetical protein
VAQTQCSPTVLIILSEATSDHGIGPDVAKTYYMDVLGGSEYEEVGKLYDIGPKASTYDYTLAALLARDLLSRTAGS